MGEPTLIAPGPMKQERLRTAEPRQTTVQVPVVIGRRAVQDGAWHDDTCRTATNDAANKDCNAELLLGPRSIMGVAVSNTWAMQISMG